MKTDYDTKTADTLKEAIGTIALLNTAIDIIYNAENNAKDAAELFHSKEMRDTAVSLVVAGDKIEAAIEAFGNLVDNME